MIRLLYCVECLDEIGDSEDTEYIFIPASLRSLGAGREKVSNRTDDYKVDETIGL